MKRLKKACIIVTLLLLILTLLSQKVYADNTAVLVQDTEYSEEFKKWVELTSEQKEKVFQPRIYDIPTPKVISRSPFYLAKSVMANTQTTFNLRDVIPLNMKIKNQGTTNSCWAFATLSSLETNLALRDYNKVTPVTKEYDYSERHMEYATSKTFLQGAINPNGYNREVGQGGNWAYAQSYLTNGSGAILETDMPFVDDENQIPLNDIQEKTVSSQVYDTVDFPNYQEENAPKSQIMGQIKQHIQNYGSVFAFIHGASSADENNCYDNSTGAKYCNNSETHLIDHAVSIVGWDDNYAIEKFPETARPTSKGAWIIRNSWGEKLEVNLSELKNQIFAANEETCKAQNWNQGSDIPDEVIQNMGYTIEEEKVYLPVGDNGYMYVSYEDCNISTGLFGIVKASDKVDYKNIYQYDYYYPQGRITVKDTSTAMLCNVFEKATEEKEYLTQVSLYTPETYTCKVYVNPTSNSKAKNDLQLVSLKAGQSETFNAGYHTLEFDTPIEITGEEFVVVVEIQEAQASEVNIATECTNALVPALNNVTTEIEKCFVAVGNNLETCVWNDLGTLSASNLGTDLVNSDSTIKAFTVSEISEPELDDTLQSIEVIVPPTKTEYIVGEDFDETGMQVRANYNSATSPTVLLRSTDYVVTNGINLSKDQTSVTITYKDKSVNQPITVTDPQQEIKEVTKIEVTKAPDKVTYSEGENFDRTGMIVTATYSDNTTAEISNYTIENGTNLSKGQTSVTIKYEGKTTTQAITVEDGPKNSDFSNIKLNIKNVKGYIYTDTSKETYVVFDVNLSDILVNKNNDKAEYYYYISPNANEKNIENWAKIDNIQIGTTNLQFSMNTKEIPNYKEIEDEEVVYLYIKEVVTKGNKQDTVVSKSMNLKVDDDAEIEIYIDDVKIDINDLFNTDTSKDDTQFSGNLPETGVKITVIVTIVLLAGIGIILYIRYKIISKYVK